MRIQGKGGRVEQLSDQPREVRSIRLTDRVWDELGSVASQKGITRADLLEMMSESGYLKKYLLPDSLTLGEILALVLADHDVSRKGKDSGAVKRVCDRIRELTGLR